MTKIKYYSLTIKSDTGKFTVMTSATSAQVAREKVATAYNCPVSAIIDTLRVNKLSMA